MKRIASQIIALLLLVFLTGFDVVRAQQDIVSSEGLSDNAMTAMEPVDTETVDTTIPSSEVINVDDTNANATMAPTQSQSQSEPPANISIAGVVTLQLNNLPSLIIGQAEIDFLNAVSIFLTRRFRDGGSEVDQMEISTIGVLEQYRRRRLQLTKQELERGASVNENANAPNRVRRYLQGDGTLFVKVRVVVRNVNQLNLDALLALLFSTFPQDFVDTIKDTSGDPFFSSLSTIQVESTVDDTGTGVDSEEGTPAFPPSLYDNLRTEPESDDFWSIGVIVGIAAGIAVLLVLLFAVGCRPTRGKKWGVATIPTGNATSQSEGSGIDADALEAPNRQTNGKSRVSRTGFSRRNFYPRPNHSSGRSADMQSASIPSLSTHEQASDLESQGLYSYLKTDSDSIIGGVSAINTNSVYGNDDMSYAYSLQAGIETSVAPGYSEEQSTFMNDDSIFPVEISQIDVPMSTTNYPPSTVYPKTTQHKKSPATSPSDFKLTESEIAMLPPNLRGSLEEISTKSSMSETITKTIETPSGKLGLVIDTTFEGPVVHHVNSTSALKGKIFPGDIIVAIDDVDTRVMSASAITALMVKTAHKKRKLTVVPKSTSSSKAKTTTKTIKHASK